MFKITQSLTPQLPSPFSHTCTTVSLPHTQPTDVPPQLRLQALQSVMLLIPDENREALLSLLTFLKEVSDHADTNQVTTYTLKPTFSNPLLIGKLDNQLLSQGEVTCDHLSYSASVVPASFLLPRCLKLGLMQCLLMMNGLHCCEGSVGGESP